MTSSLLAYLLIPLFSAVIIQFLRNKNDKFADIISNVTLFAGLINIVYLIFNPRNIKLSFSNIADGGFSLIMVLIIYLVSFCVSIFSSAYIPRGKNKHNFYSLLLVATAAMCGVVTSTDLFTLYIYVEALAVASFAMICYDDTEAGLEGALKYFLLTFPASIFIMTGIAILLFTAGTFNLIALKNIAAYGQLSTAETVAVSFVTLGFLIKSGVVPFHAWTPDAYHGSYSPVSAFLAGIVTKVSGVYAVILIAMTFNLFNSILSRLSEMIMLLGMVTVVVGAIAALRQKNLKRMLAFSSVSQVGYIVLAAGMGTPLAIIGAIFHVFNHALFKGVLFLNSASVEKAAGTVNMYKLGGLEKTMPWTSWTSVIALLATAGIPPLSGFWSKFIIILALWEGGAKVYSLLALLFSIVTLAYFMIMQKKMFFGKPRETSKQSREIAPIMLFPVVLLSAVIVAAGIFFPYMYTFLAETVARNIL